MEKLANKFMLWFEPKADTKAAKIWLFVISFTESFIFPIPVDPFMAIVILVQRKKWIYFVSFYNSRFCFRGNRGLFNRVITI
jgi:membrane protein YqaA with SNARE-associated domain